MTTKAIGNIRLLMLADFLETLPRKRFVYTRYVGDGWKGNPDLSCGTTACALGWAATIPSFKRAGLRLRKAWTQDDGTYAGDIVFGRHIAGRAANAFFGLTDHETADLFYPGPDEEAATPKYVAKKIRKFVKERG